MTSEKSQEKINLLMNKNKLENYLKIAMIIGGFIDLIMVVIFLVPALRIIIFGENPQFHTPQYEWAMRLIGSLGSGWTVLLFWASRKPFERKDILLFTVFPLMMGAYLWTIYGFLNDAISLQFFVLFTIITFAHCPFFLYIWIKAKKFELQ